MGQMKDKNLAEALNKKLIFYRITVILLVLAIPVVARFPHKHVVDADSLIDPARKFLPVDNYIVNIQGLREYLMVLGAQYPDNLSIYYEQVNSGANISINRDLKLFPASLSKLVQAILVASKVEQGVWSWDTELKVLPEDLSTDSGDLYKRVGDKPMTVESLLEELLVNSDNTAQNVFRHYMSEDDYITFQDETGLQDLYNSEGFISAKEYTRILRVLYGSTFLHMKNSEKILRYMTEAKFKDYLSQGIPSDVKFAHKFGEHKQYGIFAESGIVYVPGKPYMITVLLKGQGSPEASRQWAVDLMRDISIHAYEASK